MCNLVFSLVLFSSWSIYPQKEKLVKLRQTRDQAAVDSSLSALTECAETGKGNLLDLSIQAVRARCTVGEISEAMEKVHGRHVASTRMVSGAYLSEYGAGEEIEKTMEVVKVSKNHFAHAQIQFERLLDLSFFF